MDSFILVLCCVLFFAVGFGFLIKNILFAQNAAKTTGEIVKITDYQRGNRTIYSSVIEFKTINNRAIRFPNPSSSTFKPEYGEKVQLIYHEDKPEKAKVGTAFQLYIVPVIIILMGILLLIIIRVM